MKGVLFNAMFLVAGLAAIAGFAAFPFSISIAWAYVLIRVVHSFIQATGNIIMLRFTVFAVGSVVLFALLVRTALALN